MKKEILFKDYYRILGIDRKATIKNIKIAFRKRAMDTHPDKTGNPHQYEHFILIREAYDVLTTVKKRNKYNSLWDAYHGNNHDLTDAAYCDNLCDDLEVKVNTRYSDEWKFFVRDPDDYLNMFDKSIRIISVSILSLVTGIIIPTAVIVGITLSLLIISILLSIIIFAFISSSLSSIIFLIISVHIIRNISSTIKKIKSKMVSSISKILVYSLKGIPMHIGKYLLYLSFTASFIGTFFFGYHVLRFLQIYTIISQIIINYQFQYLYMQPGFILLSGVTVLIAFALFFPIATLVIFDVIKESLYQYPPIRYLKLSIKKQAEINYYDKKFLNK